MYVYIYMHIYHLCGDVEKIDATIFAAFNFDTHTQLGPPSPAATGKLEIPERKKRTG